MKIFLLDRVKNVWVEHISSLFYDDKRRSFFFFNKQGETHFEKIIYKFEGKIKSHLYECLHEEYFEWLKRQCPIKSIDLVLPVMKVVFMEYGQLYWYAFYNLFRFDDDIFCVIYHINYSTEREKYCND
jgi:hypothetical protein